MGAISDALQKLQNDNGSNVIKKFSVPINADTATKLFFLTQALGQKEDAVTGEILTAALNEAWDELKQSSPDSLPTDEAFQTKLKSTSGKKKKVVKKPVTESIA